MQGDEEARYSSVVRPGQQAARPGSASSRPLENGAGSAKGVDIPSVATRYAQSHTHHVCFISCHAGSKACHSLLLPCKELLHAHFGR